MASAERLRSGFAPDGHLRVSGSTLDAVASCSTLAMLKAWGWTTVEEHAALRAGAAVHEALADYFGGRGEARFALATYEAAYREWATANVAPGDRLSYTNTSRILSAWLADHPLAALPFTVKHVEIDFEFPLDETGEVTAIGRLDAIGELRETGDIVVIEHKSTGNMSPFWLGQFRRSAQLSCYTAGAQAHLGGSRVVGAIVNAIEFGRLPSSDGKCKQHAVAYAECGHLHAKWHLLGPVERTPAALEEWRKTALHLARRYRDLLTRFPDVSAVQRVRQQGMFTGACRGCAAAEWCSADRDPALLPSLMARHDEEAKP